MTRYPCAVAANRTKPAVGTRGFTTISDAAVQRAAPGEAARWALGEATVLRGREEPTRIATVGAPT